MFGTMNIRNVNVLNNRADGTSSLLPYSARM